MSDNDEKQFEPTPARLAKARRDGDIPRVQELGTNLGVLAGAFAVTLMLPVMAMLVHDALLHASQRTLRQTMLDCVLLGVSTLVPIAAQACATIASGFIQSGGMMCVFPAWKAERLNPFSGIKRMGSIQTLMQVVRGLIACGVSVGLTIFSLIPLGTVVLHRSSIPQMAASAWQSSQRVVYIAGTVGLLLAAIEYAAARSSWMKRLRMSFDEHKRSTKEQDGDPQLRGRRRSFHRALSRDDVRKVKKAAFVVCNPAHIAVAIAYDPHTQPVPRVLVRAADAVARQVREVAAAARIPIVENVPLARALYAEAKTGLSIPYEQYLAIAEIVVMLARKKKLAA